MFGDATYFMCRPLFYGVEYVINPWMEGNIGRTARVTAAQQWEQLYSALALRARIQLIDPLPGLPDMAFTANAGLAVDDVFVPARFRFPQRQPEVRAFTAWFRQCGYRIVELPGQGTFEGEGDALFQEATRRLWCGYGVRSSLQVYPSLGEIVEAEVVALRLVNDRFYHLDTCFCALPGGQVFYYPGAFDSDTLAAIEERVPAEQRYPVSADDALHFACNAVATGGTIITNHSSQALRAQLEAWGYAVVICPLSEFILAGGAAKCLVLRQIPHGSPNGDHTDCNAGVAERLIELRGHLLDRAVLTRVLDRVTDAGGSFEMEAFQPGLRHDQQSSARLRVVAPCAQRLDTILHYLAPLGAHPLEEDADARLGTVTLPGVAPDGFYGTTILPTDVRIDGRWVRALHPRMDAVLVAGASPSPPTAECRLLRDLRVGDRVVCGSDGVRVHAPAPPASRG